MDESLLQELNRYYDMYDFPIWDNSSLIDEQVTHYSEIIKQRISQYDSKADNFLYRLFRIAPQHPFRNIPLSWLGRAPQNQTGMYVKCPKGMTWYLLLGFQKQDNQLYGVSMIYHSAPPECILIPIESIPESVLSIALKAYQLFYENESNKQQHIIEGTLPLYSPKSFSSIMQ